VIDSTWVDAAIELLAWQELATQEAQRPVDPLRFRTEQATKSRDSMMETYSNSSAIG